MRYADIRVNPAIGRKIGELYTNASPVMTPEAKIAYDAFIAQTEDQFRALPVKVIFQDDDPYADAAEMMSDVRRGTLRVYRTRDGEDHPYMTHTQNDHFRAVHDFHGHFMAGVGFDRHGEEAAWMRHSRMYRGVARRAMTTETRGQSSAFIWVNGGRSFPEQKAILLPEWVSR